MPTNIYADSAGFVNSPGFGALLALLGTLLTIRRRHIDRQQITQPRTRALAQRSHPRGTSTAPIAGRQSRTRVPRGVRADTSSQHHPEQFYELREPYYDQCKNMLPLTAAIRLITGDSKTVTALDQIDVICRDRRADTVSIGGNPNAGAAEWTELKNATDSAFAALQAAAVKHLAK